MKNLTVEFCFFKFSVNGASCDDNFFFEKNKKIIITKNSYSALKQTLFSIDFKKLNKKFTGFLKK